MRLTMTELPSPDERLTRRAISGIVDDLSRSPTALPFSLRDVKASRLLLVLAWRSRRRILPQVARLGGT